MAEETTYEDTQLTIRLKPDEHELIAEHIKANALGVSPSKFVKDNAIWQARVDPEKELLVRAYQKSCWSGSQADIDKLKALIEATIEERLPKL